MNNFVTWSELLQFASVFIAFATFMYAIFHKRK
nr:MAG TPA: holin [Caudoviricetes sp.]DAM53946.1 MAG TPA: holin [Caudoviricetes sp.]